MEKSDGVKLQAAFFLDLERRDLDWTHETTRKRITMPRLVMIVVISHGRGISETTSRFSGW